MRALTITRLLTALLLATALCACATRNEKRSSAPHAVKVITYNIRAGLGNGDKTAPAVKAPENIPRIAEFLRGENPDVIFLQEVDRNVPRSGSIDETALLAESLGYRGEFAKSIDLNGGDFGVAILSRWPITSTRVEKLFRPDYTGHQPPYPDYYDEQRVALIAHLASPEGDIVAICTHLGLTADQRVKQLETIAGIAKTEAATSPVIFAGDLNAHADEPELSIIRGVLNDSWSGLGEHPFTFPWDKPNRCIDYVYTSTHFSDATLAVPEVLLSDHRPVIVGLKLAR